MRLDNLDKRSISSSYTVDNESRKVEGYAIRFDEPSQDLGFIETICRGAVSQELIENSDVFCLFNHNPEKVLARSEKGQGSLTLRLDEKGLIYSFEAPHTPDGDALLEHLRRGEIKKSSFAFTVNDNDTECVRWYKSEDGVIHRDILKLGGLFDVSPVFTPAYDTTSCSQRALDKVEELRKMDEEEEKNEPVDTPEEEEETENTTPVEETQQEENTETSETPEEEETDEKRDNTQITNKSKMNKEFRLLKAIYDVANNKNVDEVSSAVFETGANEMRKSGLSFGGQIQIPTSELRAAITVAAEGEDVVVTDMYDILEPLRAKNVLVNAGAKFLTNLVGDVQVPVMSGSQVTWEGETADASEGGAAFTHKKLSPKRLTAYIDISKQFLVQDSLSAESLLRQDLINAINTKLEETILGSAVGTSTKPQGIFYLASGTLDTVDSYADIADFEAKIEDANINGECKYIMSNKAKAAYRTMIKGNNATGMVYEAGGIDGTPVLNTSHVENKNLAYGDWSSLAIGQWGAIDLTVDPYTMAKSGQVRIVINAFFDAVLLRPEAIVVGKQG